ncbi:MAG: T9SS type A sorting domain-containing protein [Sphingobacteriales bacterium]|nr:T9SS type A sorting domain-containing protein [Sphingobacteriales bacterium]
MRNKDFDKRLAGYSALAAGLLATPVVSDGQILYTDQFEDLTFGDTSGYIFDFNYDYFHDLLVFQAFGTNAYFVSVQRAQDTEILGKSTGNYLYPFALDAGYLLDTINKNWRIRDYGTLNWQGTAGNYGYWQGVNDKYLGIKIKIDGKPYLGWARLDVAQNGRSFTIKDFAIEFTSGKSIRTGDAANTYGVTKILAQDLGNGNGLKITFDKAVDESKVSEYRIILKNVLDSTQLTPNMALNLSPPNIVVVPKTGFNIEKTVNSSNVDLQGNPLKIGQYYQVYVLSMPDGVHATEPILSTNRRYFAFHVLSSPAGTPVATDIGNNGNGQDLKISFAKAADEQKVAFYSVVVCKSEKAQNFTIEDAMNLPPSVFTNVPKTGGDLEIILSKTATDADGALITNNVKYKAFVISVADGTYASKHALSLPSDEFMLTHNSGMDNFDLSKINCYFSNQTMNIVVPDHFQINSINIFDLHGKQIAGFNHPVSEILEVPFGRFSSGIYLVKIDAGDKSYSLKVTYFQE